MANLKSRTVGSGLSDQDRERLRGSIDLRSILNRLGETAMGLDTMSASALSAARILVDKSLPSLQSVDFNANPDVSNPNTLSSSEISMLLSSIQACDDIESTPDPDISVPVPYIDNDCQNSTHPSIHAGSGGCISDPDSINGVTCADQNLTDIQYSFQDSDNIADDNTIQNNGGSDESYLYGKDSMEPEDFIEGGVVTVEDKAVVGVEQFTNLQISDAPVKNFPMNGSVHTDSSSGEYDGKSQAKPQQNEGDELQDDTHGKDDNARGNGGVHPQKGKTAQAPEDAKKKPFHRRGTVDAHSTAGTPDSAGHAPRTTLAGEGVVKGSLIPSRGITKAGKIR